MTSTIQTGSYKGYINSGAQTAIQTPTDEDLLEEKAQLLEKQKKCGQRDIELSEKLMQLQDLEENGMVSRPVSQPIDYGGYEWQPMFRRHQLSYKLSAITATDTKIVKLKIHRDSSQEHGTYSTYSMNRNIEFRKIQKNSANQALLVSLPFEFTQTIPLSKGDVVKIQLMKDRSIILEKAT